MNYTDVEGMIRLKLAYLDEENPKKKSIILAKMEKLKNWEHPRVLQKIHELHARKIINWKL